MIQQELTMAFAHRAGRVLVRQKVEPRPESRHQDQRQVLHAAGRGLQKSSGGSENIGLAEVGRIE
jgi:hypothetical protein